MEEGEVSTYSHPRRTRLVVAAYLVLFLAAFMAWRPFSRSSRRFMRPGWMLAPKRKS